MMTRRSEKSSPHHLIPILLTLGVLALATLAGPQAALADGKRGKGHGKGHGRGHEKHYVYVEPHHSHYHGTYRGRGPGHLRFEVPRAIHGHYVRAYEPYYYGRSYFAPHRHHHVVYAFPVYYDPYGYPYPEPVYYPYAYCEGGYFARGVFTDSGPHFSIGISIVK